MTKSGTFVPTPETDRLFSGLNRSTRTFVAIDGSNLDGAEGDLGFKIDYALLREMLEHYLDVASSNYFTAKPQEKERNAPGVASFHDFLDFNGYRVHYKPISLMDEDRRAVTNKTNVDVDLAVETMRSIYSDRSIGQLLLFSGDGDFISLIRAVRPMVRCAVVSTEKTQRPHLSRNLKKAADVVVELADIAPYIQRGYRTPKPITLPAGGISDATTPTTPSSDFEKSDEPTAA